MELYDEHSDTYKLLRRMRDTYCLVNLVDEEYPQPNILFKLLDEAHACLTQS